MFLFFSFVYFSYLLSIILLTNKSAQQGTRELREQTNSDYSFCHTGHSRALRARAMRLSRKTFTKTNTLRIERMDAVVSQHVVATLKRRWSLIFCDITTAPFNIIGARTCLGITHFQLVISNDAESSPYDPTSIIFIAREPRLLTQTGV